MHARKIKPRSQSYDRELQCQRSNFYVTSSLARFVYTEIFSSALINAVPYYDLFSHFLRGDSWEMFF
jgi:hypothetical protein